jgi:hypothetical protein
MAHFEAQITGYTVADYLLQHATTQRRAEWQSPRTVET